MQSDFGLACKSAREAIAVPAIPLDAILSRAQARRRPQAATRRPSVLAGIVAGLSIAATAAAAVLGHAQISLSPSGVARVSFDGNRTFSGSVSHPQEADFQRAARAVNFPAVFPKGLPEGTVADYLTVFGADAIGLVYDLPGAQRRSNHLLFVFLANPKAVVPLDAKPARDKDELNVGQTKGNGAVEWAVGGEEVVVLKSTITPAELAHFKATMTAQAR
jgi:hypothetical protein